MKMIERMARTMCSINGHAPNAQVAWQKMPVGPKGSSIIQGIQVQPAWMLFFHDAKAVLADMMEPTEVMLEASAALPPDAPPLDVWKAMIGAAIRETDR